MKIGNSRKEKRSFEAIGMNGYISSVSKISQNGITENDNKYSLGSY